MRKLTALTICLSLMMAIVSCGSVEQNNKVNRDFQESYEGPIIPLSSLTPINGVEAERIISFDFTDYDYTKFGITNYDFVNDDFYSSAYRSSKVRDNYTLHNTTDKEISMQVIYSFMGKLETDIDVMPTLLVDGEIANYELVLGHTLAYEYDEISALHNRGCYEELLEEGNYIKESVHRVKNTPELLQKVKVYKIETIDCGQEELKAKVRIKRDVDQTRVYVYGIETFGNLNGLEELEFDVLPDQDIYIIAEGEDVCLEEILCYTSYQKKYLDWEEEGILNLQIYEAKLEDVVKELVEIYRTMNPEPVVLGDVVSNQLFVQVAKQYMDSQDIISLDSTVFSNLSYEYRMWFQILDITIPRNGAVEVKAEFMKSASVVGVDKKGYDCYELITLSSADLHLREQTLKILGADDITISEHTSGDMLEKGILEVQLLENNFQIFVDDMNCINTF